MREVRGERYTFTGGFFPGVTDEESPDQDPPRLRTVVIGPEAAGNGVMLERLNLGALGVKVTAVRRKGVREANPSADTRLQTGDAIVLLGPQEALARAEIRLLQG